MDIKDFNGREELEIAGYLDDMACVVGAADACTLRDAAIDIRFLVRELKKSLKGKK